MNTKTTIEPEDDRLLKIADLCERWGVSRPTLWRLRQTGGLPPPVRVSPGVFGWLLSDIVELERGGAGAEA